LGFGLTLCDTQCIVHPMRRTAASPADPELLQNLRLELRRGCLVLAALAALRTEEYGYTLRKSLADRGLEIDEGTLYPLLRRLETQGLLVSEWREHDKRNKRFYRLSGQGRDILEQLAADWRTMDDSLAEILGEKDSASRSLSKRR